MVKSIFLLFAFIINSFGDENFCRPGHSPNQPLHTRYFTSFLQTEEPALGCVGLSSGTTSPALTTNHVLQLQRHEPGDVYVQVLGDHKQRVSLMLDCDQPTTWRLDLRNVTLGKVLVDRQSRAIHMNGSSIAALIAGNGQPGLQNAFDAPISTFTTIKQANKIFLRLPEPPTVINDSADNAGDNEVNKCDLSDMHASSLVTAFATVKVEATGCFHADRAGQSASDVHVVDLSMSSMPAQLNEVEINIFEESHYIPSTDHRNMTLILKCDRPTVTWSIKSTVLLGSLTIVVSTSNRVQTQTGEQTDWARRLNIDKTDKLSNTFSKLIDQVTETYGLPLSYLNIYGANLLHFWIPPKPAQQHQDSALSVSERVKETMSKDCSSVKSITVAVPIDVVRESRISSITLNDPSCKAASNGTHYVVVSHSTACGSTALSYGNSPLYRNNLVLQLAGHHQTVRVPYLCKFKPGIPFIMETEELQQIQPQQDDTEDLEEAEENFGSSDEMYGIEVELIDSKAGNTMLLQSRHDAAPVALNDSLYIQSHINAVQFLALAIEQCWLSSTPKVTTHAQPDDLKLVMAGCPAHPAVEMHWDRNSANAAFSLKINEDISTRGKVWLQCRMGLCSATSAGAQGNIFRCEDPAAACRTKRPHRESTVQQVTVRGPMHILPVTRAILDQIHPSTKHVVLPASKVKGESVAKVGDVVGGDSDAAGDNPHPPHGTFVGVTIEVAVAISFASFMVGACSTGALWFIHSKTVRVKGVRHVEANSNGGTELKSVMQPAMSATEQTTLTCRPKVPNRCTCSGCPLVT